MTPEQARTFHIMMVRLLWTAIKIYEGWVSRTFNLRLEESNRVKSGVLNGSGGGAGVAPKS